MKLAIINAVLGVTLVMTLLFCPRANADCFYDTYGNQTCINTQPNPYDTRQTYNSPHIYENGQYKGNLNNNQYDPNSVSNPYGVYGNPYSPNSVNNPYRIR